MVLTVAGTGFFIYLKTAACKKGEYNICDMENSEATHRQRSG